MIARGITCLLLVCFLMGCASAPAFFREQAIARATDAARQSAPEVGILEARIDNITAELTTLRDADARLGGGRGPGGYAPGQTPDSPVWWVSVRGFFRYQGIAAPPGSPPICEADERDFIYDARTGEEVGGSMPNTRCAPGVTPMPSTTPSPTPLSLAPAVAPADNGYPPWVGTPVAGSHPRSDQPLPAGIANGDIIEGGNLLWFVWDNTKSRIWFPNGEAT